MLSFEIFCILKRRNYAFTFKPGFSLYCQQPFIEAVLLILPFSFFLCGKVEAVTLNFGLLAIQSQEERTKKRGKPPALQPSVIQNTDPNPNPLQFRCCLPLSLENSK